MKKFFLNLLLSSVAVLNLGEPLLAHKEKPEDSQGRISCRPSVSAGVSQLSNKIPVMQDDSQSPSSSHPASTAQEQEEQAILFSLLPGDNQAWDFFGALHDDLKLILVDYLSVKDIGSLLQVSRGGYSFDHPDIWRDVLKRFKTDYQVSEVSRETHKRLRSASLEVKATKENVVRYVLRVRVNLESEPEKIKELMNRYHSYGLNTNLPFQQIRQFILHFIRRKEKTRIFSKVPYLNLLNAWAAQEVPEAIELQIEGFSEGKYGFERDSKASAALNEKLVSMDNLEALKRKLYGLTYGRPGYKQDPEAAVTLNEKLVAMDNLEALEWKIEGLAEGRYGYKRDPKAAVTLNEALILKGDLKAIHRKINGLADGSYGYKQDPEAAVTLNEVLILKGDLRAIHRKINGLADGSCGYKQDPEAAVAFNEKLVAKGDPEAIERKIEGLADGLYGYKKDREAAVAVNEMFVEKDVPEAIMRQIIGYSCGKYGYTEASNKALALKKILVLADGRNVEAIEQKIEKFNMYYKPQSKVASVLNEVLVKVGNLKAIERKIEGLTNGTYGYEKDHIVAFSLNELLIAQDDSVAIKRKLNGLLVGDYGYKKDYEAYKIFKNELGEKVKLIDAEMQLKMILLSVNNPMFVNNPNRNVDIARKEAIEEAEAQGEEWAYYLKALGLKFGDFGFEQDLEAARQYILENNVPY